MDTLTSEKIKRYAIDELGADKVGIANIERFKDAPKDMSPTSIMPRARSVIVFIKQIPRGCYRGIDEGTHWPSYTVFGYLGINRMLSSTGYKLACFVEKHGYEASVITSGSTSREIGPRGPVPAPGMPRREVTMHHRITAVLAGVGEIGWSKVFLTEEFGPRQRIGIMITDAPLEPAPIVVGKICDKCKRCVSECPGCAISKDRAVSIDVEGHHIEWNDIDIGKCKLTHFGINRKTSPFLIKRYRGLYMPIEEQEVTWLEAHDIGFTYFHSIPTFKALRNHESYIAICGARGCIIGCMKHLEKKGVLTRKFKRRVFSEEKPWIFPERPEQVDHKGFVYDPENDDGEDNVQIAEISSWY